MVIYIMVNLNMEKEMDLEKWFVLMEILMKVNLKKEN